MTSFGLASITAHDVTPWRRRRIANIALLMLLAAMLVGCGDDSRAQRQAEASGAEVETMNEAGDLTQQRDNLEQAEFDFANAPEPMRDIAWRIALGERPGPDELRGLGGDIDRSYPNRPRQGMTLLSAALRFRNLEAIDALFEAGADPLVRIDPDSPSSQGSQWDFLFLAVTVNGPWIEEEDRYDMTFSNQVLALYLEHGAIRITGGMEASRYSIELWFPVISTVSGCWLKPAQIHG
jgi:hypothetical protein